MNSSASPQTKIVVPGFPEPEPAGARGDEHPPSRALPAVVFREIFEREYGYVRSVARRLGIRERELDDLVHDVFLAVHRKLGEFVVGSPLRPWLFGITFRVVVGTKRRFGYTRERLADLQPDDPVDASAAADEQLEVEERRRMVHEALLELDIDKRAVFIMHELDELPISDVSTALDIPVNTAYSRLRLARKDFRASLERLALRRAFTRRRVAS